MCFSVCIINRGQVKGFVEKKSLEREKFLEKLDITDIRLRKPNMNFCQKQGQCVHKTTAERQADKETSIHIDKETTKS